MKTSEIFWETCHHKEGYRFAECFLARLSGAAIPHENNPDFYPFMDKETIQRVFDQTNDDFRKDRL